MLRFIMYNNTQKCGWLPENGAAELRASIGLMEYANRSTSYTLNSFARSRDMDPRDIEDLARFNIGGFSNTCAIALYLITIRQKAVDAFVSYCWQDKNGEYWQEVQLMNKLSRKWFVVSLDRLS